MAGPLTPKLTPTRSRAPRSRLLAASRWRAGAAWAYVFMVAANVEAQPREVRIGQEPL